MVQCARVRMHAVRGHVVGRIWQGCALRMVLNARLLVWA